MSIDTKKLRELHNKNFALTNREEHIICANSIERVINTTTKILEKIIARSLAHTAPSLREDAMTNFKDWYQIKALVRKMWERERNEIFIRGLEATDETKARIAKECKD